jgi:EAL domain-containing protein (putative c-di-GMP-specific phosphodiesterase class I)
MAMYQVKENGKNNYQNYSASLQLINNRKMEIENGIREAIENEEFTLYYQPQIELNSRKIIGVEALIRWKHHKFGFVSPEEFIPLAEETGLIVPVGNWVLKTACRQFKSWLDAGIPLQSIAVNVSAIQFQDINFVKTVEQILHDTKLDSSYLELEITESVTQQVEEATRIMKELKSLGVNLSIDDFGTGYSSLNYLRHFPFDKIKIDKSFVDEISHHLNGEVLARTIIELGKSLGFQVIAEGVENEHQVSFLKENNCHFGQGYLFSKPLPTKELENLLKISNISE